MSETSDTTREEAALDSLYPPPAALVMDAITDYVHDHHISYLRQATFFAMATGRDTGLDVSPRGGPAGFLQVLDRKHLAFGDFPGNNRIESMRNLSQDDRIALLFIFPGLDVFLRVNGRGSISVDAALLDRLIEQGRRPKTAIVIEVREVLFHCGRAISRSRLWDGDVKVDRKSVPSIGVAVTALAKTKDMTPDELDVHYKHSMETDLY